MRASSVGFVGLLGVLVALVLMLPGIANAHCDTMDGPVVTDAKAALEKGDVTPVLKWVKPQDEATIRTAFDKTMIVRSQSPEAKELADMYFFETLVRIHRAGEGVAYTGLKPAGTEVDPGIADADKALETGDVDKLATAVAEEIETGIRDRFDRTMALRKCADTSVDAGREYVAYYVSFIHYVEKLHLLITSSIYEHHDDEAADPADHAGEHE